MELEGVELPTVTSEDKGLTAADEEKAFSPEVNTEIAEPKADIEVSDTGAKTEVADLKAGTEMVLDQEEEKRQEPKDEIEKNNPEPHATAQKHSRRMIPQSILEYYKSFGLDEQTIERYYGQRFDPQSTNRPTNSSPLRCRKRIPDR